MTAFVLLQPSPNWSVLNASDAQLIASCLAGDSVAWSQLIDRYGRLVFSVPRRYGLSDADCDDVFAAVWAALLTALPQLRDHSRLSSWLITTAHRQSWRISNSRPNTAPPHDLDRHFPDLASPADDLLAAWERQHLVRLALLELGGRCEQLLRALFLEPGMANYQAIASRLGISVGAIGPTRARCFQKLQVILKRLGLDAPTGEVSPDMA